jgi:hypothetical protein
MIRHGQVSNDNGLGGKRPLKDGNGRLSTIGGLLATRLMHGDYDNNLLPARRQSRDQYRYGDDRFFNSLPTVAVRADELIEFDDAIL